MTWPAEYQRACQEFEKFMVNARDAGSLATTNMAWTMVQAVLLSFRKRLTIDHTITFANALPPLLRALFLDNWTPTVQPQPFLNRAEHLVEIRALRAEHNFSPDDAQYAVARALREAVGPDKLDEVLSTLPGEAREFWRVESAEA